MYRSKLTDRQAAVAPTVNEESERKVQEANPNALIVRAIMVFKSRLMAPFMFYDRKIRQVVPNPAHDRLYRSEVSRVQGAVLRELRHALESESGITPKEMLYAVQKSVLLAYASCAVSSDSESLISLITDEDATAFVSRLETFFAERVACAKSMASLAAVLSTGIVRDTLKEVCNRLETRIAAEEKLLPGRQRTKENQSALDATKKNTRDLVHLADSLLTAFEAISVSSSLNSTNPLPNSAMADASTAVLTVESYYSLLGWVLMMQPERLSLAASRFNSTFEDMPQEAGKLFAEVTSYDPATGRILIERRTSTSKWGVMLNASGNLIGLENTLRNATQAGEVLYQALQQTDTGLRIFTINDIAICPEDSGVAETASAKRARLEKIRGVLQGSDFVISLTVAKVTTLAKPQEVAFDVITQGGEGAAGQQAVLILKRASTEVQWQLKMRMCSEGLLILEEVADTFFFSDAAQKFFTDYSGRLVITNVNGCDTSHSGLFMDVVRSSLYLVLRLRVTGDVGNLTDNMAPISGDEKAKLVAEKKDEAKQAVDAAGSFYEEREAVEDEEAEVAHHRALLEEHNIHPDEPLPEVVEADEYLTQTKKGRPKKISTVVVDKHDDTAAHEEVVEDVEVLPEKTTTLSTDVPETAERLTEEKGKKKRIKSEKNASNKKINLKKATKKAKIEAKKRAEEEKKKKRKELNTPKKMKKQQGKEEEAVVELAEEKKGFDATSSLKEAADAQGVLETPLVKLKSSFGDTVEVANKVKSSKRAPAPPTEAKESTINEKASAVSVTELKNAPPLTFENAVTLDKFDGTHMELRRPDTKTPWDMKVSLGGDKLVLTRLPPISAALKTHPFFKSLQPDANGQINWCVDMVNGTDLTTASKTLRAKALESIKKANKISLVLKQLIK